MKRGLNRSRIIKGTVTVPGDKSISHRAALFSILSEHPITAINYSNGADCQTSLKAAESLGVVVKQEDNQVVLTPSAGYSNSENISIDCGNSGTTARLISGIIAGSEVEVTLTGDKSLSARPMKRVIDPLTEMGAEFYSENGSLPLRIRGKKLLPFEYKLPVASAQVKSALLLSGLASHCSVTVREDSFTRDHTERMIQEIGEGIEYRRINPVPVNDPVDPRKKRMQLPEPFRYEVKLLPQAKITGGTIDIPGDISTAAFFMAAAAIGKGTVTIENVGLNPTRTGFIDHLKAIGCDVMIENRQTISNEPRGALTVKAGPLKARKISGETTVGLIDEIPLVAVLAAFSEGTTIIRDAAELKVKESNRLEAIHYNLNLTGAKCGLLDDGLVIEGIPELSGGDFRSFDDHRIVMAMAVMSLHLSGPSTIDDDSSASVSCPEFFTILDKII
jgi:3-phosphoshikimate 1-carboxyvinyltransferase